MVAACTDTADRVLARHELVSLTLTHSSGTRALRLDPAPGAQINAQLPPFVEFSPTERVQLSSAAVNADTSYFVGGVSASVAAVRVKRGVLKASVCPANLRVCRYVELPIVLP